MCSASIQVSEAAAAISVRWLREVAGVGFGRSQMIGALCVSLSLFLPVFTDCNYLYMSVFVRLLVDSSVRVSKSFILSDTIYQKTNAISSQSPTSASTEHTHTLFRDFSCPLFLKHI